MTGVERVLCALRRGQPDRAPTFEWLIDRQVREALYPSAADEFNFAEQAGLDGVVVYEDIKQEVIDATAYRDEWGITYRRTREEYPVAIDHPIKSPGQIETLRIPDPVAEYHFESLRKAVRRFKGDRAILFRLRDAYSMPRYLRGVENLMMDIALDPETVRRLVSISVDYYGKMAHAATEQGADVLWSSDDYCDNRGPLMGATRWKELFLPGLRQLVSKATSTGLPFIKHADGNINPILPELVGAGINCIDPIDAEAGMDLASIKERFGGKIAIKGGVPVSRVLSLGTLQEVERSVEDCLRIGGAGGGYIVSSSSDITSSVKPENYRRMLQVIGVIK